MRPPLNVLVLVALPFSTADRYPNDFSPYPAAAQPCLNAADQESGCDGSSVPAMNGCLCTNASDFIPSAARCISRESPRDLNATYATLKTNCDGSNTPMAITMAEFLQLGDNVTSTTRQMMPEETHQDDEESTEGSDGRKGRERQGGGLETGAKIGIAISAVVVVGLISAGIAVWRILAKRPKAPQETPAEKRGSQRIEVAELE